jgi:hypothetical protein
MKLGKSCRVELFVLQALAGARQRCGIQRSISVVPRRRWRAVTGGTVAFTRAAEIADSLQPGHQPQLDTPAPVRASSSRAGASSTLAVSISRPGLYIQVLGLPGSLACGACRTATATLSQQQHEEHTPASTSSPAYVCNRCRAKCDSSQQTHSDPSRCALCRRREPRVRQAGTRGIHLARSNGALTLRASPAMHAAADSWTTNSSPAATSRVAG